MQGLRALYVYFFLYPSLRHVFECGVGRSTASVLMSKSRKRKLSSRVHNKADRGRRGERRARERHGPALAGQGGGLSTGRRENGNR